MIIGISGKSGTGKTKISEALAKEINANLISFDNISHMTIEKDSFKKLVKTKISPDVFDNNGNIDRKKLGSIVFADKVKLNLVNNHSEKLMVQIIDKLTQDNTKPHIIYEYSLLPLMKYFEMCDFKILITANDQVRFSRIKNRDNISDEYLKSRESNSINYIKDQFDLVVENNSNEEFDITNITKQISNKEQLW